MDVYIYIYYIYIRIYNMHMPGAPAQLDAPEGAKRTRILYKDFSRAQTVSPIQKPMPSLNMVLVSIILTVAHMI